MIRKIIKKRNDIKNLKMIEESGYFDEQYYLMNNQDVKKAGANPLKHYYYNGWKEGRNPNENFNNNKYIEYFGDIKENPIIHYLKYKDNYPDFVVPYAEKLSASKLIEHYFMESKPLKTKTISNMKNHRLNIVYNGFDKSCFFGGKATALILAVIFCEKYSYDLRIISQDPEANIFYDFLKLFNLDFNSKIEFFSIDSGMYLNVGEKDDFLCTMWSNADGVLNTPNITGKIFYIMQEVETFFYDHGDNALRCFNTLSSDRIIPIVNSKLLYDYLIQNGYDNVKKNGIYFEPAFSKELLKPSKNSFAKKKKYNFLYYARPSHQRNIFYFGLEVINEALKQGILNPEEWTIYVVGDNSVPSFQFDVDVKVEKLGVMSWKEYCDFLSNVDLCYGMIYTPHPSYPPLDSVSSGAVSLTNKYANKQDLSNYSKNIICADLKLEAMLQGLLEAQKIVFNPSLRKDNYENSHTYNTWNNAFKEVVEFMNKNR